MAIPVPRAKSKKTSKKKSKKKSKSRGGDFTAAVRSIGRKLTGGGHRRGRKGKPPKGKSAKSGGK